VFEGENHHIIDRVTVQYYTAIAIVAALSVYPIRPSVCPSRAADFLDVG